jgi:hypothetical protein
MERAHTTETVQGGPSPISSSASVESVSIRVHSRKHSRALDPQGLYEQVLGQEAFDTEALDQAESLLDESLLDQSLQEVSEQEVSACQILESQSTEAQNCDSEVCETFDASPVENSDDSDSSDYSDSSDNSDISDAQAPQTAKAHSGIIGADDRVSKKDLVSLLEGFVRIIKTDDIETSQGGSATATGIAVGPPIGTGIELARPTGVAINEARVDDRTVEIDQLRGLVIEAQDTIIKLLTDRVDDRSRIATLEAQLSLLPDLQAQADRAMSVAVRTDEYRTELTKMKFELDRFRLFRVRVEAEQKKGSVFNRIQKWLFSRPNAKNENTQRDSYQKMVDGSGSKNSAIS